MTVQEIIKAAMRTLGVIATGETPTNEELQDGMEALNLMLRSWYGQGINVHANYEIPVTLAAGTASYSVGTAGTVAYTRPSVVFHGFIRDANGHDYPLDIITDPEYRTISEKTTRSRPTKVFYEASHPLGYFRFYPTPDATETAYLYCNSVITAFTALTDTVQFPAEYEKAIKFNLAMELAPEYGKEPSQFVVKAASDSLGVVQAINLSARLQPVEFVGMPGVAGRQYDINEG